MYNSQQLVNTVSTPIAFWTIDKFGRRPLLITGAAEMCVCRFIVAIVSVATRRESNENQVVEMAHSLPVQAAQALQVSQ
jgi:MFS family permease